MTDAELLEAAIDVAGEGRPSAFARWLGDRTASRVFAWRAGTSAPSGRPIPPWLRRLCRVIIAHPEVARWWTDAA